MLVNVQKRASNFRPQAVPSWGCVHFHNGQPRVRIWTSTNILMKAFCLILFEITWLSVADEQKFVATFAPSLHHKFGFFLVIVWVRHYPAKQLNRCVDSFVFNFQWFFEIGFRKSRMFLDIFWLQFAIEKTETEIGSILLQMEIIGIALTYWFHRFPILQYKSKSLLPEIQHRKLVYN